MLAGNGKPRGQTLSQHVAGGKPRADVLGSQAVQHGGHADELGELLPGNFAGRFAPAIGLCPVEQLVNLGYAKPRIRGERFAIGKWVRENLCCKNAVKSSSESDQPLP